MCLATMASKSAEHGLSSSGPTQCLEAGAHAQRPVHVSWTLQWVWSSPCSGWCGGSLACLFGHDDWMLLEQALQGCSSSWRLALAMIACNSVQWNTVLLPSWGQLLIVLTNCQ